jgi:hypothetical protein
MPTATTGDYWYVLAAWTRSVADTLAPGERDLFWLLCCLEEHDRERWILGNLWPYLWGQLGRDGVPPSLDDALLAVVATGLATVLPETGDTDQSYTSHPGVAEAGRAQAGTPFRDTADTVASTFWASVHQQTSGDTSGATVHTGLAQRAGLAAVPYLIRQQQWADAAYLLERVFFIGSSRANAAAMLPAVQEVACNDPRQADVLALVLQVLDPPAAETMLRDYLAAAVAAADYRAAAGVAGRLVNLCRGSGRLSEALAFADQKIAYARQASLGPWTQLANEGQRLQVLAMMGQAEHVLAEVARLRGHMDTLPDTRGPEETAIPWNTREALLDTGLDAAIQLAQWGDALDLNAANVASQRDRAAPTTDIARTRFNDYGPLLHLGRTDQALALLQDCLQVFQDAHDITGIGKTLGALASIENQRGHGDAAVRLEFDALRHKYLANDVTAIAISYHNLGLYLPYQGQQPAQTLASHLTASLIRVLIGIGGDNAGSAWDSMRRVAKDLREFGPAAVLPTSVADLDRQLGDIPGTDLPGLIRQLCPDAEAAEQALRGLIAQAQEVASAAPPDEQ